MSVNFAKLFDTKDLGQILVTVREEQHTRTPQVIVSFRPEGFGVCDIMLGNFGSFDLADTFMTELEKSEACEIVSAAIKQMGDTLPDNNPPEEVIHHDS